MSKKYLTTLLGSLLVSTGATHAQNLIFNGRFDLSTMGWTTSCVSVEAWGFEPLYGGTDPTNHVAEIDDEACMHQDICILPGRSYKYSMDATRRTGGGAADTIISNINISGLDATGTVIATYVNMNYERYNTVFAFTPVTGIPAFYVPAGSGVVKLRLTLTDSTPGYSTFGMIIDSLSLTFVSPPMIVSGPDTTCINSPVSMSVSGPTAGLTFLWNFGAGATPLTSSSATPSVSWSTSGTYPVTLLLSNGYCIADTLHTNVVVGPQIVSSISGAVCNGSPYVFGGVPLYAAGVYSDTFITPACDSIVTLTLTVNPKPAPPSVTPVSYCQGEVAAPLAASGLSLMWYGPDTTSGYSTAPIPATTAPGTVTYYVTQTVAGCTSDSAAITVTIKPSPAPPTTKDVAYCQGATALALAATGSDLLWYTAPAGGTGSATSPVPSTGAPGTATWYVSQVVNGCESGRTPINVTIMSAPVVAIGVLHTDVCVNDTVSLYISGSGAATHYWELPGDTVLADGSIVSDSIAIHFSQPGYKEIYLSAADTSGRCTSQDSVRLHVVPVPWATMYTPNACLGDTVLLALEQRSDNADSFTWYADDTLLLQSPNLVIISRDNNSGGPFDIVWTTPGPHVVAMYTKTMEGCRSALISDSIKVNVPPDASFTYEARGGQICLEDSVYFRANTIAYGDMYEWLPTHSFNNTNEPEIWGRVEDAKSVVTLTVTDPLGCKATNTVEIDPAMCCMIAFPDAFTPNGDGKNDYFHPLATGYHVFHQFRIYNRWGQTVFESASNELAWDGSFNGVPQDMGVYYYFVQYDCGGKTLEQKGDVTLIR